MEGKVDGVVFGVNYAKEPGVAEILGASATEENLTIQKYTDVVAIAEVELISILPLRIERALMGFAALCISFRESTVL